jgi:hypothetical protein
MGHLPHVVDPRGLVRRPTIEMNREDAIRNVVLAIEKLGLGRVISL